MFKKECVICCVKDDGLVCVLEKEGRFDVLEKGAVVCCVRERRHGLLCRRRRGLFC